MNAPKQIIVMRKDLNMRKGKMCAQASHASMKVLLDYGYLEMSDEGLGGASFPEAVVIPLRHPAIREWLSGKFTKICVYVNSEQELVELYKKAREAGIICAFIEDSGATEFNGVPTRTCCAIGPEYPEKLDPITGHLPLL